MKRISAVVGMVCLSVACDATEYLVGIEQGYKRVENATHINGVKEDHDKSLNISSLKIGGVNGSREEGDRYELLYNFGEENIVSGLSTVDFSLHYNLTFPSMVSSQKWLPYLRLGASYTRVSENEKGAIENPKYEAYGYILGLGSYYLLANNLELSAGFDYGDKKWNNLHLYQGTVKVEAKSSSQKAYIGLNYLF